MRKKNGSSSVQTIVILLVLAVLAIIIVLQLPDKKGTLPSENHIQTTPKAELKGVVANINDLDLTKAEGIIYLPLYELTGGSDSPENISVITETLRNLQQEKNIKVLSWGIDKQQTAIDC